VEQVGISTARAEQYLFGLTINIEHKSIYPEKDSEEEDIITTLNKAK